MNLRQLSAVLTVLGLSALGFASYASQQATPRGQERDVTITDDDQTTTMDCKGGAVTVSGDDNKLTLQGECSKLTISGDDNVVNAKLVTEIAVSGDDNRISVETVARIHTSGDDNNVRWTRGVGGKPPEISNTGDDNTTRQAGN